MMNARKFFALHPVCVCVCVCVRAPLTKLNSLCDYITGGGGGGGGGSSGSADDVDEKLMGNMTPKRRVPHFSISFVLFGRAFN